MFGFLDKLPRLVRKFPEIAFEVPPYPEGTHKPFWDVNGLTVSIQKYDPECDLYVLLDNPYGPASLSNVTEIYALDGKKMTKEKWETHPEVVAARVEFGLSL